MTDYTAAACTNFKGEPKRTYHEKREAAYAASDCENFYGKPMKEYHCHRCSSWHVGPADREWCSSCGKNGYCTLEAAERQAEFLKQKNGVELQTYACSWGGGWHLTKG